MEFNEREAKDAVLDQFNDPDMHTREVIGHSQRHTDVDAIKRAYGVKSWDAEIWDWPVVPDVFVHTWEGDKDHSAGGTDLLGTGKPGSGKSTFLNHAAKTILEANREHGEPVTWRGATSRSEWLPLHRWTRLLLPAHASLRAELVPRDPVDPTIELDPRNDLEKIVRDVIFYEDPREINEEMLEPSQFHVIYPDPSMTRCQEIYEESSKTIEPPSGRDEVFHVSDPVNHWWFAYLLDRVENGPFTFQTQILDEIGDIAPEAARNDQYGSFQKVELLRDVWVDARKTGLTLLCFGHSERDVHNLLRHKIRWRVTMNGASNPTKGSPPVGFETVPMEREITSRLDLGQGLMFSEQYFETISWPDYPKPTSHQLKIHLAPEVQA